MNDAALRLHVGGSGEEMQVSLRADFANRHGLISGATGTGKTVTLQVLAENFSKIGVPVFTADVKGDLSGLAESGKSHPKIIERVNTIGVPEPHYSPSPVLFWDIYGEKGHPIRTTISEVGPILLANILDLNETQEGVLHIAFRVADDEGLLLLDLKDLQALLKWIGENRKAVQQEYGNVSPATLAAIQRRLLVLEESGADFFFGEPALELKHFMKKDFSGRGVINILDSTRLIENPRLYATFLLWLLSELFEELDEVGDADRPRLVFFFDEAHLLFENTPRALVQRIEQVVRLIRSKGVGVYFVTQHPLDIPDEVLGQLAHRFQHALRAFTPRDQKAVKAAAETFRQNPEIDTESAITELGIGEALVSILDEQGSPTEVERVLILPPHSRIGPVSEQVRKERIENSPIAGVYEKQVDRDSAYELLKKRGEERAKEAPEKPKKSSNRQGPVEAFFKSVLRSVGSQFGRQIARGILGTIGKT